MTVWLKITLGFAQNNQKGGSKSGVAKLMWFQITTTYNWLDW
jgi:hypothetical protein